MKRSFYPPKWIWIGVVVIIVAIVKFDVHDGMSFHSNIDKTIHREENGESFNDQHSAVTAERWIVLDGTDISNNKLLDIKDVHDWRILVFSKNIQRLGKKRCSNCLFLKDVPRTEHLPYVINIKMASYLHAISHGAKWIYATNQSTNLGEQIEGFHFEPTVKGLLYNGKATFDPDRHFGANEHTTDLSSRTKYAQYLLGDYRTPSVQSKWNSTTTSNQFDIDISCRLPHTIVPAHMFPPTNLMGSLIEYRSFWTLGSLITDGDSPAMTHWWVQLMVNIQEGIGKHPPSCRNMSSMTHSQGSFHGPTRTALDPFQCSPGDTFFKCGVHLAQTMEAQGLISTYDVHLLKSWFDTLVTLNFNEPTIYNSTKSNYVTGSVHRVVFETTAVSHPSNETFESPFQGICGSKLPSPNSIPVSPIRDILLIVIFNYPSYYSNILYLDYINRKYFTNIVYCGSHLSNFGLFQVKYPKPISFLEVNEMDRGVHGYLCSAYAMEMGFKVSGYLQMSDDVLVNMWNVGDLPRDKIWFQQSIRRGSLKTPKVPNITPVTKQWYWWPWNARQWGVIRLKEIWARLKVLTNTPERERVDSFFNQLKTSFGQSFGAFYEASDIFYVPDKHKNDFSFFSKISWEHRLFLEIAIPTMLCGFDHINNIIRLKGTYLWYKERTKYPNFYNPENHFLHPWKLKELMTKARAKDFFCTKYLPYIEGRGKK